MINHKELTNEEFLKLRIPDIQYFKDLNIPQSVKCPALEIDYFVLACRLDATDYNVISVIQSLLNLYFSDNTENYPKEKENISYIRLYILACLFIEGEIPKDEQDYMRAFKDSDDFTDYHVIIGYLLHNNTAKDIVEDKFSSFETIIEDYKITENTALLIKVIILYLYLRSTSN